MELNIEPHVGVGQVCLSMGKEEVRAALGEPSFSHENRETFLAGLHVHYYPDERVEFIEVSSSDKYTALFKGIDVHTTPAEELVAFILRFATFDANDPELGYGYIFKDLQLSLWRSVIPETSAGPDGQYFEAIGIGSSEYFA